MIYPCKFRYDLNKADLVRWVNQITAANAGRASQFRFVVNGLVEGSPIGAGVNREKEFRSQLCSSSGSSVPREKCALQCMTRTCHF